MRTRLALALASILPFVFSACEKPQVPNLYPPVQDSPVTVEESGWENPVASPEAKRGGMFTVWSGAYPKSLNVWLDRNTFSGQISGLMFESLATLHPTKNEWVGVLAKSWEISDDGMTFTFHLHPAAKWSNGEAITAEDIRFYYDVMMDPKNLTTAYRMVLDRLHPPEVVDAQTIRVRAKNKHWSNFSTAAELIAFPKKAWEGKDFNQINFEFPVVSGPYQLERAEHNQFILMKRRGDWWGRVLPSNRYIYNFDYLRYRSLDDQQKALDLFKQGNIDLFAVYTSAIWAQQTNFDAVQKHWVARQEVRNQEPKSFQGFAVNLRRPLFQDKNLREALAYLLNRELMNEKLMFNSYFLLNSFYPDLYPDNRKPDAPFYAYNPAKARELLAASGWKPNAQGVLEKDGKTLAFKFLHHGPVLPHYEIFMEDLKRVGIQASMDIVDGATVSKRVDNHEFDLLWQNFSAGRERDPEPAWSSAIADAPSTSNYAGVKDAQIDELIAKQKGIFDADERNEILKQIDTRLTEMVPFVLLWQSDRARLLYWNRFGTPEHVLDKYNREDIAAVYWWADPEKEAALKEARTKNQPLPELPSEVRWEE